MSDTPRTDALDEERGRLGTDLSDDYVALRAHAERLERELANVMKALRPFAAGYPNTDRRDYLRAAEALASASGTLPDDTPQNEQSSAPTSLGGNIVSPTVTCEGKS